MNPAQYYLVLLRKGPAWTADETPELDALQEAHLAHICHMENLGKLVAAGPTEALDGLDLRGIHLLHCDAFQSVDELKALVEQDPAILAGRLRAEYFTWYHVPGITL